MIKNHVCDGELSFFMEEGCNIFWSWIRIIFLLWVSIWRFISHLPWELISLSYFGMNACGGFAAMKQDIPWDVGDEFRKYNSSLRQKISLIQVQKILCMFVAGNHQLFCLPLCTPYTPTYQFWSIHFHITIVRILAVILGNVLKRNFKTYLLLLTDAVLHFEMTAAI